MMQTKTASYDIAEFHKAPEVMAAYPEACSEESEGDAAFIAKGLEDFALAKGIAQIASETCLLRE